MRDDNTDQEIYQYVSGHREEPMTLPEFQTYWLGLNGAERLYHRQMDLLTGKYPLTGDERRVTVTRVSSYMHGKSGSVFGDAGPNSEWLFVLMDDGAVEMIHRRDVTTAKVVAEGPLL